MPTHRFFLILPAQELIDYFFYALLRTQGEDTTDERSTANVVPVTEVPNIMRALGYYPTEQVRCVQLMGRYIIACWRRGSRGSAGDR